MNIKYMWAVLSLSTVYIYLQYKTDSEKLAAVATAANNAKIQQHQRYSRPEPAQRTMVEQKSNVIVQNTKSKAQRKVAAIPTTASAPSAIDYFMPNQAKAIQIDKLLGVTAREVVRQTQMRLNFGPFAQEAQVQNVKAKSQEEFVWTGKVKGEPLSQVVLSYYKGYLAGTVMSSKGTFSLVYSPEHRSYTVEKIEDIEFGHDDLKDASAPFAKATSGTAPTADGENNFTAQAVIAGYRQIDIMFVYSNDAVSAAGTKENLIAKINAGAELTNQAFINSAAMVQLNIVGYFATNYTAGTDFTTEVNRFSSTNDGFMDEIHALRTQTKADLYSLVIAGSRSGTIGIAYYPGGSRQGSSTISQYFVNTIVLGHEIGHNFGLSHQEAAGGTQPLHPYGRAFQFSSYRTALWTPYSGTSTNIPYYSNPNIMYKGLPTGVANQNDEARAINDEAARIAGFKAGDAPTTPAPAPSPAPTAAPPPPPPANVAPVARAGADQSVMMGAVVTIDASASSDANGGALTYAWAQLSGPMNVTLGTVSGKPAAAAFTAQVAGNYVFRVTVTDSGGLSSQDSLNVTVVAPAQVGDVKLVFALGAQSRRYVASNFHIEGSAAALSQIQSVTYTRLWNGDEVGGTTTSRLSTSFAYTPNLRHLRTYVVHADIRFKDGTTMRQSVTLTTP